MAMVEIRKILDVDKKRLFQTLVRYEDYPNFVFGVKSIQVERKGAGRARVTCRISIIKDIFYTLELIEDESLGSVEWHLIESNIFKVNRGFWKVKDLGLNKTEVRYRLELEFKVPVPRILLRRVAKGKLPFILKCFEEQAQHAAH